MNVSDKPLRISRLIETDFMGIRAIDIAPDNRKLIIFKGPNGAGKSSACRAIIAALGGKNYDPEKPIRSDAKNATVDITLSDEIAARLRVVVSWTPGGRYLTLKSIGEDGERPMQEPQSTLRQLVNVAAFAPLEFLRAKPAEQLAMLLNSIGRKAAFDEAMARRREFFDRRRLVNREIKDHNARHHMLIDPAPGVRLNPRDESEVLAKVRKQQEASTALMDIARKVGSLQNSVAEMERRIPELETELESLRKSHSDSLAMLKSLTAQRDELSNQSASSYSDVSTELNKIRDYNAKVQHQRIYLESAERSRKLEFDRNTLNSGIAAIDAELVSMLARSDLGRKLPGITVAAIGTDDNIDYTVLYNGVPINQISGMEGLRLSTRIGIELHRQLRVMFVDEADMLDAAHMKELERIATEENYQIWMTANYAGDESENTKIIKMLDGIWTDQPKNTHDESAAIAAMYGRPANGESGLPPQEPIVDISNLDL